MPVKLSSLARMNNFNVIHSNVWNIGKVTVDSDKQQRGQSYASLLLFSNSMFRFEKDLRQD